MYSVSSYFPRSTSSIIYRTPSTGTNPSQGAVIYSQQSAPKQYLVHYGHQSATFAPTPYGTTSGVYRRTTPISLCPTCR